jgi:hypothetical protein
MKKIILFFLLPAIAFSQYVVADFIVLNDGADSDYHKLEKVWSVYHQKSVDSGEKLGWSVWKRTATDNDNDNAARYVVFNNFSSKEQRDKTMKNWSMNQAISIMKAGLKGKMSSKTVDRIVKSGGALKKEVRIYNLELVDATPFVGELKIGDKMSFAAMIQKRDDYEEYESKVWKPVFEREILRNNYRWWAITKIVKRNEPAYKDPTHLVWNVGVQNGKPFVQDDDFMSKTMRSGEMVDQYRTMLNPGELTLVYKTN